MIWGTSLQCVDWFISRGVPTACHFGFETEAESLLNLWDPTIRPIMVVENLGQSSLVLSWKCVYACGREIARLVGPGDHVMYVVHSSGDKDSKCPSPSDFELPHYFYAL